MGNMDRSWMKASHVTEEYENGVEDLLQYAERNAPSLRGKFLSIRQSLNHIRTHFICHGIIPNYKKCIWHGELADRPTIFHAKPVNVDMGHRIEDIIHDLGQHEMYLLLFSITTTQVDVPSTCTTKDVPSNVLRQSSQAGKQKISQAVSPLKSFVCGKGKNQILRLCHFELFDKGKGRHKRIQTVSPLFFWKREKRDTQRIQAVSPWRILFGKGRRE
ncbi:hypothetical protein HKD37_07G018906 [Glycine soja]